jgi:hypothetical protein
LHQPLVEALPPVLQKLGATSPHPLAIFVSCIGTYPLILGLSWLYYQHCELPSIALGKMFLRKTGEAGERGE